MGNGHEQRTPALVGKVVDSGAQKFAEGMANHALSALVDFVRTKYGHVKVRLGTDFQRYLENATRRYNIVRTVATGQTPRAILGKDSLYVQLDLSYEDEVIGTSSVNYMLSVSHNILIQGTGGIGKSMLMRYLFLHTARCGDYVPVLVELRRISNQNSGELSIIELIYSCMQDFDIELPREQFEYSLQLGKYLFLFDGLDEIKTSLSAKAAETLQRFSAKYPKNPCVITSRPRQATSPLETFTIMEPKGLSKQQAVDLASRIWPKDEKTREFCRQLSETLYDKHLDFAENPLLLSMMFLTFMRNSSIPDHLADFYQKAYDALYSIHDSNDKGTYHRDFQCKGLDEDSFKRLLAHFCFQTYLKEEYEFSIKRIRARLTNSIQKLKLTVTADEYLTDLQNVVCMIIKDGDTYRFSHRSFQAYFAAYYTAAALTDEEQKRLFSLILSQSGVIYDREDYYRLLIQLQPERLAENALEEKLRALQADASASENPNLYILKAMFRGIRIESSNDGDSSSRIRVLYYINRERYIFNLVNLFGWCENLLPSNNDAYEQHCNTVAKYMRAIPEWDPANALGLSFKVIDTTDSLSDEQREELYDAILQAHGCRDIYEAITVWLSGIDEKRTMLEAPNFIDTL